MHREAERASEAAFAGPLVGRDDELGVVLGLLDETPGRLVSITGRGGVGKTRLALEVLRELGERGHEARGFVPFAAVTDPALVIHQVASTVGVHELPGVPMLATLAAELAGRGQVLVLDSFEHVAAAAPAVQQLLAACAGLRLLVTTQVPLRLRAEQILRLAGLSEEASVAMYCDRAAAVDADFRLTERNAADVHALCRDLEGLPLAIELAAARVVSLPAGAVSDRLERHRLDLLQVDYRDVPERHRALRAAISWSYELLDADAQHLLRSATVTGGSFDLDDAEALAGDAAFDALGALVDVHLVDPDTEGPLASYRVADSIREFAAEQIAPDERDRAETTWLHSLAIRARDAAVAADTADEASARRWLTAHQDQLVDALTRCLDRDDLEGSIDVLSALVAHWTVVTMPSAYLPLVRRALDAGASAGIETDTYVATLGGASIVLRWSARADMLGCLDRAESLATSCPDERAGLHVLAGRALSCAVTGDLERSREAAREGLARATELDATRWVGRFEVWGGMIDHMRGDEAAAVRHGLVGMELARRTDDERMIVEASALLIPLKPQLPDRGAALPSGDEIIELAQRTGHVPMLLGLLPLLAMDALADGDVATATARCADSLRRLRGFPSSPIAIFSLMCAAQIADANGDAERVASFHGVLRADLPTAAPAAPPRFVEDYGRMVASVEQALGPREFEALAARGEAAGRPAGIDDALAWVEHQTQSGTVERKNVPGRSNDGPLSPRQREVLVLMASGLSNKEIAGRLGITRRTAEHHSETIFRKLSVRGRTEAAAWAHRNGLVPPDAPA